MTRKCYIIDSKRSPIGRYLGSMGSMDVIDAAIQVVQNGFDRRLIHDVDKIIIGNVFSAGCGQGPARNISLMCGCKQDSSAYTIGMVCGSGMQAVINGFLEVKNDTGLVLAGGFESMSSVPYAVSGKIRSGLKMGNITLVDLMLNDGLIDGFTGEHMGITAENIARDYHVTREEQDEYAYNSIMKSIAAIDGDAFKDEIVPVSTYDKRHKPLSFEKDESPNRETSLEKLAKLKPAFMDAPNGTVTAGNSSSLNDGAAFVLMGAEAYCKEHGVTPKMEVVDGLAVGCNPHYMGLGPYYAITKLLEKNNMHINDIDYMEINEAFAVQCVASLKLLGEKYGVDPKTLADKCNKYGSGIGLGHPLGMTGARIVTTLSHVMEKENFNYGIASLCIGGGMGAAVLLKKVE